ncbi:MAG: hypothetical protein LC119_12150 [Burkholderiales bacterium]|nr:hypothetical protein [Burkholderiales bacterium]
MPHFAEVTHREWIAAAPQVVRAQFGDLEHHIRRRVHPGLRLEVLARGPRGVRFLQEVRLLGIRQRDVFERRIAADGSIEDRSVEGFNRGGSLLFRFTPGTGERAGSTEVEIVVRLPLPPLLGPLVRPLLQAQIRREVRAAARQDKHDIEVLGYPAPAPAAR